MKQEKYWEWTCGFYPGILFGFRTYQQDPQEVEVNNNKAYLTEQNHVFYIPFFDICYKLITIERI